MRDQVDAALEDAVLMEEVELISTLMIAASESEGPLSQCDVDVLLGIGRPHAQVPEQPDSRRGASPPTDV